ERVESMLGTIVGREKVIARVAAAIDFARVERTEESFDPDKAVVRMQHTTKEETTGAKTTASNPSGAPGTASNLTNDPSAQGGGESSAKSERRDETQNYEISKTVSRTVAPVGGVKQLSVAVVVDGTYKEENGQRTFVPRPDDELDKLRELTKSAVGFN